MKKFIVLTLVLCMASLATAGLSFTSNPAISGNATLSLTATMSGAPVPTGYEFYLVVADSVVGSIGEGTVVLGSTSRDDTIVSYAGYYKDYALYYAGVTVSPAYDSSVSAAYGFVGGTGEAINGIAINNIAFTFAGEGTIRLLVSSDGTYGSYSQVDSIIVTPEPMTMALLGVGALFLRRRRK